MFSSSTLFLLFTKTKILREKCLVILHTLLTHRVKSSQILRSIAFNSPNRWKVEGWQKKRWNDLPGVIVIASDRGVSPEPCPKALFPPSCCFSSYNAVFLVRGESDPKSTTGSQPVSWIWRVKNLTHREKVSWEIWSWHFISMGAFEPNVYLEKEYFTFLKCTCLWN